MAEDLFYNTPVRLKFLKKPATEAALVSDYMLRLILSHPEIAFRFVSQGKTVYHSSGDGKLESALYAIYGREAFQQMRKVSGHMNGALITGYVGAGELSRGNRQQQSFFVNGRYLRHPYFHKAVMDAYEQLVPVGEQVSYFLYFDVEPANIDVNIHPTKTEIKFENEQAIWQILSAAIKESLGKFNAVPSIDFDTEGMPDIPAFENSPYSGVQMPKTSYNPSYNPFDVSPSSPSSYTRQETRGWDQLYEGLEHRSYPPSAFAYPDE